MLQLTLEKLREAMKGKMGSTLTPELAAEIICAAIDRTDRALDPQSFPPRAAGDLVFQAESFRDVLPELIPLHEAHYLETEQHLAGVKLAPDYDYMAERERRGHLVQFTARDATGQLVGNLRMYLGTSLHTGRTFAEEDTFYLSPAARRGINAIAFLRYAEDMLARYAGVAELRANTKTVNSAGVLLARRGFKHVANQFIKLL
jgi:hypothetical protein